MSCIDLELSPITTNICTTPQRTGRVAGTTPMIDNTISTAKQIMAATATARVDLSPALGAMCISPTLVTALNISPESILRPFAAPAFCPRAPVAMNSERHFSISASSSTAARLRSTAALSGNRLPSQSARASPPPVVTVRSMRLYSESCPNTSMSKVKA